MKHYSELELERYRNRDMPRLFRFFCKRHLDNCPSCRAALGRVTEDMRLESEIRNSAKMFEEIGREIDNEQMRNRKKQE